MSYATVYAALARKQLHQQDCTEDESAAILAFFDDFPPGNTRAGGILADFFPLERDQWWAEHEQGLRRAPEPARVVIERTSDLWRGIDGDLCDRALENLNWQPVSEIALTARGAVVQLTRPQRLVYGDRTWYGMWTREVELRVWHDGSITIEREEDR